MIKEPEAIVRHHYGGRLEMDSTDLPFFCGWRLRVYGTTIAVGESELEMWQEAYEHICEILELNPETMEAYDEEDDAYDEDSDKQEIDLPSTSDQEHIVRKWFGHRLTVHPPNPSQPFWRVEEYGRTIALARDPAALWIEAYEKAELRALDRSFLHASTGMLVQ